MAYQAKYLPTPGVVDSGKVQLEAASVPVPTDPTTASLDVFWTQLLPWVSLETHVFCEVRTEHLRLKVKSLN
jgi:hypothetical protein